MTPAKCLNTPGVKATQKAKVKATHRGVAVLRTQVLGLGVAIVTGILMYPPREKKTRNCSE